MNLGDIYSSTEHATIQLITHGMFFHVYFSVFVILIMTVL